jgi:uncharacterized protein (TIGR03032 family)
LSMPHSPRWHRDKLWILESGKGTLSWVDLGERKVHVVAELPGFTRGIDFAEQYAFIGLSQIRESNTFGSLPITDRLPNAEGRGCGVWVVNIETGETFGFLKFTAGVQEIFGVSVLRGIKFPEIVGWNDELMYISYMVPDEIMEKMKIPEERTICLEDIK